MVINAIIMTDALGVEYVNPVPPEVLSAFRRGLVYSKGIREKSHYALLVALRCLFSDDLGVELVARFGNAMNLREEADYGLTFSEAGAIEAIETAEALLKRAKDILKV